MKPIHIIVQSNLLLEENYCIQSPPPKKRIKNLEFARYQPFIHLEASNSISSIPLARQDWSKPLKWASYEKGLALLNIRTPSQPTFPCGESGSTPNHSRVGFSPKILIWTKTWMLERQKCTRWKWDAPLGCQWHVWWKWCQCTMHILSPLGAMWTRIKLGVKLLWTKLIMHMRVYFAQFKHARCK